MQLTPLEKKYYDYMNKIALSTLRMIGREAGVANASSQKKDVLITKITDIYTGKAEPAPQTRRGAPTKQKFFSPDLLKGLDAIREEEKRQELKRMKEQVAGESLSEIGVASGAELSDITPEESVSETYSGILEIMPGGYGFVRVSNCQPKNGSGDVFVSGAMIHSFQLREGDAIVCTAKSRQKNNSAAMEKLISLNTVPAGRFEKRRVFDTLTAQYPQEKIEFSRNNSALSLRILDLFVPIGKGQRALIIAPPKAGKTTLLKDIARSINENHKEIVLIVLLIDERPEEVTDIRMSVEGAEIIYSTFDEGAEHHVRAASLTLAHAKRMAEMGKDVVILLDSLTKLTRAYNNLTETSGKTLSGGLEAGALAEPKRFFGAARNTVEAGSITILATALVDTGSRMDDVIYEEFKGTGNADVFLSRDLAERRIFPAIDIRRSGTRKEELLLSDEELSAVYKMRERGLTDNMTGLFDMMKRTADNREFISRLPEWLRIYKNV